MKMLTTQEIERLKGLHTQWVRGNPPPDVNDFYDAMPALLHAAEWMPKAVAALRSVAEAIAYKDTSTGDPSWNQDAHIEIVLTVAECRAVNAALDAAQGADHAE